ncbi:gcn5-related n-acetyltransferase [Ophiostoma piceae UAMH 11346]|uniref:Gcn5-related n-acetyltransferase n=1 Tax=Ophiostoma piceae (strain UAMH 11346) TaxID=1262450 RepID=S3CAQ0_OPHP1|nr:gcn5-related n-acetyltransferase [Ophiostoma piceae UAMH 11346]
MATADPLIDPAITESDLSSVVASPSPNNNEEAAAAAAAAAVDALAASQYGGSLGDDLIHEDTTLNGGPEPESEAVSRLSQLPQETPQTQQPPPIRAQPAPAAVPAAFVQHYNPAAHSHLALYLAALHGSRITADNLSGTFAPPLHHEKLLDWWKVQLTTSAVFLLIRPPQAVVNGNSSGYGNNYQSQPQSPNPSHYSQYPLQQAKISGQDLVGVIMLQSHPSETSPHVATIELLLVNLHYRQLGGERQLLETVEQQAVLEGRTLLSDSSMANMYKDLGFTEAGRIPGMINRPLTGEKRAQSIFYKDLSSRS